MIRIASTHFVEDWIDIQLTNFEKYIKEPYLVYTRMPDDPTQTGKSTASGGIIPDPIYEKHKHKFYKAIPGASRIAETTRVVLNEISKDLKDDDLVILMDADCFPISKNFISKLKTKLKSADLAIAIEPEHEWYLERMPHPFFVAFKGKTLFKKDSKGNSLFVCLSTRKEKKGNWWGLLMDWCNDNQWSSLERTNKNNISLIYFGVYENIFYHHWAGSRIIKTRTDRRRVAKTGEDIDKVANENKLNSLKIIKEIKEDQNSFIKKLTNSLSMKISLIQPGRNNLKYLKWSYDSIRKNQGDHEVEICVADDFSNDGTWDWCQKMMEKDSNFKAIRNEGPTRLGHTILYDRLINEVATNDICMIYHADMYLCPNALDYIAKHISPKTIVSLTRIEPPLHPPGPEKIIQDFGIEPEEFEEEKLLNWMESAISIDRKDIGQDPNQYHKKTEFSIYPDKITEGIFAPWAFYKKDFQEIKGHDPIFAPQSKEDTDIFNRFHLNGVKFIQTWGGCVYHMTCRGSRFADGAKRNPDGQVFMKNRETDEWLAQNQKSTREFIRKWGHFCKHDALMKPIVPPKYEIGIVVENCYIQLIQALEPWCSYLYVDLEEFVLYSEEEQKYSSFNIDEKVKGFDPNKHVIKDNITVKINGNKFTQQDMQLIGQLSEIIQDNGEVGEFELGNLKIQINDLTTYENDLIICD